MDSLGCSWACCVVGALFLFSSVVRKVGVACWNLKHEIGFDCWCMAINETSLSCCGNGLRIDRWG